MSFDWTSKKPNEGIATLYESYITLNKSAKTHFDRAYKVLLGIDQSTNRIAVKPVSKQEFERGAIPEEKLHKITVRPSYARVCNKKFMNQVVNMSHIALASDKPQKFRTTWSKDDRALVIDLNRKEDGQ